MPGPFSASIGAVLVVLATMGACTGPDDATIEARPGMLRMLEPWGLAPESASTEVAMLAWHAPNDACPHVYRLSARYEPALKFETDSESWLALGLDPKRKTGDPPPGPIADAEVWAGRLYYHGLRAERDGATRDVSYGRELFGPASPTAAC